MSDKLQERSEDKWTIERVDNRPVLYRWGELHYPPKNATVWFHDEMQEARERVKALQARIDELEAKIDKIVNESMNWTSGLPTGSDYADGKLVGRSGCAKAVQRIVKA